MDVVMPLSRAIGMDVRSEEVHHYTPARVMVERGRTDAEPSAEIYRDIAV